VHTTSTPIALYEGVINDRPVKVLVDSGAARNFIAQHLVETLSLTTENASRYKITFANGSTQTTSLQTVIPLTLPGSLPSRKYSVHVKTTILDLPHQEVILGKPWLQQVNPHINWLNDKLTINTPHGAFVI
jgi:hypothetical protein